jgi:hypothetical protein
MQRMLQHTHSTLQIVPLERPRVPQSNRPPPEQYLISEVY